MTVLENVKILLDIASDDTSKDQLLNLYIKRANDFIINYCEIDKVPFTLNSTVEEMATFSYRQKGVENIDSEGKGSLSERYLTNYPSNIMRILETFRQQVKQQEQGQVKFY